MLSALFSLDALAGGFVVQSYLAYWFAERFGAYLDRPRPIDAASRYACPVLSLFGGADEGIPQQDVDEFDAALNKANVKHRATVYPGAPHSFFDRKFTEFADASADAWRRVQDFVKSPA